MGGAASSTRQFCTANRHRTTRLTWPGAPVRASLWLPIVGTLVAPEAVARETCRSGRMLSLPPPMGGHASRPAPWLPREAVVAPPQIAGARYHRHATSTSPWSCSSPSKRGTLFLLPCEHGRCRQRNTHASYNRRRVTTDAVESQLARPHLPEDQRRCSALHAWATVQCPTSAGMRTLRRPRQRTHPGRTLAPGCATPS